ncbi:DUF6714 family protein [Pseudomarimonas arenosa]|uniref:Uncharacterized protein n=1 Tax=Pseudomarimonas arenosa TaxID=2774145 RepID=A0AAW3ZGM7_9GAMM|nr:DUF6714 family protein [Pseudomarimonas arenosa]MBD8524993.1 hypothetical protein [Pseudomarimonas arenosa]
MGTPTPCQYCDTVAYDLSELSEQEWQLLVKALAEHDSIWCAIGLLRMCLGIDEDDARTTAEHLVSCCRSWRFDAHQQRVLTAIDQAFAHCPRPEHFTDIDCCDECREHHATLDRSTRANLARTDLGTSGWSPLSFINGPGLQYYLPSFVRWALTPDLLRGGDIAELLLTRLAHSDQDVPLDPAQRSALLASLPLLAQAGGVGVECLVKAQGALASAMAPAGVCLDPPNQ